MTNEDTRRRFARRRHGLDEKRSRLLRSEVGEEKQFVRLAVAVVVRYLRHHLPLMVVNYTHTLGAGECERTGHLRPLHEDCFIHAVNRQRVRRNDRSPGDGS